MLKFFWVFWFLASVVILPAQAGEFLTKGYRSQYGYQVYLPDGYSSGRPLPLVVMLHGCWQDPDRFASNTRMNDLADQHDFIVVYPRQPYWLPERWSAQALTLGCWRWFDPINQVRTSAELGRILGIVDAVIAEYRTDRQRVYVAGVSAGAAMAVNLAAAYPDRFAAIGVSGGIAYQSAMSFWGGLKAMRSGGSDPDAQGKAAYRAMGEQARVVPVIVFHGAEDLFVSPVNGEQIIAQWAQTNDLAADGGIDDDDIDDKPDKIARGKVPSPDGHSYSVYSYEDSQGQLVMRRYVIDGMGHAWSGGTPQPPAVLLFLKDPFVDPRGPDASLLMWEFFADFRLPGAAL